MYGARPLRRFIQRNVETLIAKAILSQEMQMNSVLTVGLQTGALTVSASKPE